MRNIFTRQILKPWPDGILSEVVVFYPVGSLPVALILLGLRLYP